MNRGLLWLLALLAAAAMPLVLSSYHVDLATRILIFAVLAMSIDVLAGFVGRTSLCHGAIFGVATYVVIWAMAKAGLPAVPAFGAGVVAATLVAALFGLLAVRTSGVYFLLLTVALGMVVWGICLRWTGVTGGENGLRGQDMRPALLLARENFYWLVLGVAALAAWAMQRFVNSPFGLSLRGIRDSESRMRALGYNVPLHLFVGFAVSGFFAGVAGAMYAFFNEYVSPSSVAMGQSVAGLLMAIVGGVGTLFGSFIGAAAIILLENTVSWYTDRWQAVLGLVFILTMIFAPEGILGAVRRLAAMTRRAR